MADEETKATEPAAETPAEPVTAADAALDTATAVASDASSPEAEASAEPVTGTPAGVPTDEVAGAILDEIRDLNALTEVGPTEAGPSFVAAPVAASLAPGVTDELQRILHINVPVIVKLADKQLPLGDIMNLSPGSIVEFTRSADTPLELMVNNKVIGRGVAVKVGEKFGLRLDEICSPQETIRKLGEL
jgi:flagellar motor switch protein FliN/FliY